MKILARLEKSRDFWFLLITSFFFFLLRLPSLFEPYWYGDEGVYQALGLGINNGRLLYRDAFDNKPPFLYLLYGFFNSDQFLLKLVSLIFGVLSIIVFYKLSKKLFENKKVVYVSTLIFTVLFGLPLIEGNIANAENFLLLFNLLGGYFILSTLENRNLNRRYKLLLAAGVLLSISFLFKIVGLFDFAAFFVFLFFVNFTKRFRDIFKINNLLFEVKNLLPYIVGFVVPIVLVISYFIFKDALPYFIKATFSNNIGYVGYGNKFIIPQGLLILKLIILFALLSYLFIKRRTLGNESLFIYIWLLFSLFNAFFSQRPYTHYVLVTLPSLCLLIGLVFLNNRFTRFNLFLVTVTLILLLKNFNYYTKFINYYNNFISFVTDQKTVSAYQGFFDSNTPNDYEVASYINMRTKISDNIFVWGNNAQLYKLTDKLPPGRYTVEYHITGYVDGMDNTLSGLKKDNPKFIIIMPNVKQYPFSLSGYSQRISIHNVKIYERIY